MNRHSGLQSRLDARRSRLLRGALALAGASLILVACGNGSGDSVPEERQFANDPAPTREATEVPTEIIADTPVDGPATDVAATPADLLRTRGAPSTLYTLSDGRLLALIPGDDGVGQTQMPVPEDGRVLGIASSPTGDRVGVMTRHPQDGSVAVSFYREDGETIHEAIRLTPEATPVASPQASPIATPLGTPAATPAVDVIDAPIWVSWVPQGNGVLVVHEDKLFDVDIERGAQVVPTTGIRGTLLIAEASPTGEQILVQATDEGGAQRVYLIQRDTGDLNELFAMRADPGMGLSEVTWLPAGDGVLFVEGEFSGGSVMRGQLFSYLFRDDAPRLVATSGQGGPSATIRNVAVAPDGGSVAYEVSIFDVDHWSMHSMWVRSLRSDQAVLQVPVDPGHMVTALAWSQEGLAWRFTALYGEEGEYLGVLGPDGEIRERERIGLPDATPLASPVNSDATPLASPVTGATPVASPVDPFGTPWASPGATLGG
jgi:hypothetical protein